MAATRRVLSGLRVDLEALADAITEGLDAIASVEDASDRDERDEALTAWEDADAEIRAALASVQKRMGPPA